MALVPNLPSTWATSHAAGAKEDHEITVELTGSAWARESTDLFSLDNFVNVNTYAWTTMHIKSTASPAPMFHLATTYSFAPGRDVTIILEGLDVRTNESTPWKPASGLSHTITLDFRGTTVAPPRHLNPETERGYLLDPAYGNGSTTTIPVFFKFDSSCDLTFADIVNNAHSSEPRSIAGFECGNAKMKIDRLRINSVAMGWIGETSRTSAWWNNTIEINSYGAATTAKGLITVKNTDIRRVRIKVLNAANVSNISVNLFWFISGGGNFTYPEDVCLVQGTDVGANVLGYESRFTDFNLDGFRSSPFFASGINPGVTNGIPNTVRTITDPNDFALVNLNASTPLIVYLDFDANHANGAVDITSAVSAFQYYAPKITFLSHHTPAPKVVTLNAQGSNPERYDQDIDLVFHGVDWETSAGTADGWRLCPADNAASRSINLRFQLCNIAPPSGQAAGYLFNPTDDTFGEVNIAMGVEFTQECTLEMRALTRMRSDDISTSSGSVVRLNRCVIECSQVTAGWIAMGAQNVLSGGVHDTLDAATSPTNANSVRLGPVADGLTTNITLRPPSDLASSAFDLSGLIAFHDAGIGRCAVTLDDSLNAGAAATATLLTWYSHDTPTSEGSGFLVQDGVSVSGATTSTGPFCRLNNSGADEIVNAVYATTPTQFAGQFIMHGGFNVNKAPQVGMVDGSIATQGEGTEVDLGSTVRRTFAVDVTDLGSTLGANDGQRRRKNFSQASVTANPGHAVGELVFNINTSSTAYIHAFDHDDYYTGDARSFTSITYDATGSTARPKFFLTGRASFWFDRSVTVKFIGCDIILEESGGSFVHKSFGMHHGWTGSNTLTLAFEGCTFQSIVPANRTPLLDKERFFSGQDTVMPVVVTVDANCQFDIADLTNAPLSNDPDAAPPRIHALQMSFEDSSAYSTVDRFRVNVEAASTFGFKDADDTRYSESSAPAALKIAASDAGTLGMVQFGGPVDVRHVQYYLTNTAAGTDNPPLMRMHGNGPSAVASTTFVTTDESSVASGGRLLNVTGQRTSELDVHGLVDPTKFVYEYAWYDTAATFTNTASASLVSVASGAVDPADPATWTSGNYISAADEANVTLTLTGTAWKDVLLDFFAVADLVNHTSGSRNLERLRVEFLGDTADRPRFQFVTGFTPAHSVQLEFHNIMIEVIQTNGWDSSGVTGGKVVSFEFYNSEIRMEWGLTAHQNDRPLFYNHASTLPVALFVDAASRVRVHNVTSETVASTAASIPKLKSFRVEACHWTSHYLHVGSEEPGYFGSTVMPPESDMCTVFGSSSSTIPAMIALENIEVRMVRVLAQFYITSYPRRPMWWLKGNNCDFAYPRNVDLLDSTNQSDINSNGVSYLTISHRDNNTYPLSTDGLVCGDNYYAHAVQNVNMVAGTVSSLWLVRDVSTTGDLASIDMAGGHTIIRIKESLANFDPFTGLTTQTDFSGHRYFQSCKDTRPTAVVNNTNNFQGGAYANTVLFSGIDVTMPAGGFAPHSNAESVALAMAFDDCTVGTANSDAEPLFNLPASSPWKFEFTARSVVACKSLFSTGAAEDNLTAPQTVGKVTLKSESVTMEHLAFASTETSIIGNDGVTTNMTLTPSVAHAYGMLWLDNATVNEVHVTTSGTPAQSSAMLRLGGDASSFAAPAKFTVDASSSLSTEPFLYLNRSTDINLAALVFSHRFASEVNIYGTGTVTAPGGVTVSQTIPGVALRSEWAGFTANVVDNTIEIIVAGDNAEWTDNVTDLFSNETFETWSTTYSAATTIRVTSDHTNRPRFNLYNATSNVKLNGTCTLELNNLQIETSATALAFTGQDAHNVTIKMTNCVVTGPGGAKHPLVDASAYQGTATVIPISLHIDSTNSVTLDDLTNWGDVALTETTNERLPKLRKVEIDSMATFAVNRLRVAAEAASFVGYADSSQINAHMLTIAAANRAEPHGLVQLGDNIVLRAVRFNVADTAGKSDVSPFLRLEGTSSITDWANITFDETAMDGAGFVSSGAAFVFTNRTGDVGASSWPSVNKYFDVTPAHYNASGNIDNVIYPTDVSTSVTVTANSVASYTNAIAAGTSYSDKTELVFLFTDGVTWSSGNVQPLPLAHMANDEGVQVIRFVGTNGHRPQFNLTGTWARTSAVRLQFVHCDLVTNAAPLELTGTETVTFDLVNTHITGGNDMFDVKGYAPAGAVAPVSLNVSLQSTLQFRNLTNATHQYTAYDALPLIDNLQILDCSAQSSVNSLWAQCNSAGAGYIGNQYGLGLTLKLTASTEMAAGVVQINNVVCRKATLALQASAAAGSSLIRLDGDGSNITVGDTALTSARSGSHALFVATNRTSAIDAGNIAQTNFDFGSSVQWWVPSGTRTVTNGTVSYSATSPNTYYWWSWDDSQVFAQDATVYLVKTPTGQDTYAGSTQNALDLEFFAVGRSSAATTLTVNGSMLDTEPALSLGDNASSAATAMEDANLTLVVESCDLELAASGNEFALATGRSSTLTLDLRSVVVGDGQESAYLFNYAAFAAGGNLRFPVALKLDAASSLTCRDLFNGLTGVYALAVDGDPNDSNAALSVNGGTHLLPKMESLELNDCDLTMGRLLVECNTQGTVGNQAGAATSTAVFAPVAAEPYGVMQLGNVLVGGMDVTVGGANAAASGLLRLHGGSTTNAFPQSSHFVVNNATTEGSGPFLTVTGRTASLDVQDLDVVKYGLAPVWVGDNVTPPLLGYPGFGFPTSSALFTGTDYSEDNTNVTVVLVNDTGSDWSANAGVLDIFASPSLSGGTGLGSNSISTFRVRGRGGLGRVKVKLAWPGASAQFTGRDFNLVLDNVDIVCPATPFTLPSPYTDGLGQGRHLNLTLKNCSVINDPGVGARKPFLGAANYAGSSLPLRLDSDVSTTWTCEDFTDHASAAVAAAPKALQMIKVHNLSGANMARIGAAAVEASWLGGAASDSDEIATVDPVRIESNGLVMVGDNVELRNVALNVVNTGDYAASSQYIRVVGASASIPYPSRVFVASGSYDMNLSSGDFVAVTGTRYNDIMDITGLGGLGAASKLSWDGYAYPPFAGKPGYAVAHHPTAYLWPASNLSTPGAMEINLINLKTDASSYTTGWSGVSTSVFVGVAQAMAANNINDLTVRSALNTGRASVTLPDGGTEAHSSAVSVTLDGVRIITDATTGYVPNSASTADLTLTLRNVLASHDTTASALFRVSGTSYEAGAEQIPVKLHIEGDCDLALSDITDTAMGTGSANAEDALPRLKEFQMDGIAAGKASLQRLRIAAESGSDSWIGHASDATGQRLDLTGGQDLVGMLQLGNIDVRHLNVNATGSLGASPLVRIDGEGGSFTSPPSFVYTGTSVSTGSWMHVTNRTGNLDLAGMTVATTKFTNPDHVVWFNPGAGNDTTDTQPAQTASVADPSEWDAFTAHAGSTTLTLNITGGDWSTPTELWTLADLEWSNLNNLEVLTIQSTLDPKPKIRLAGTTVLHQNRNLHINLVGLHVVVENDASGIGLNGGWAMPTDIDHVLTLNFEGCDIGPQAGKTHGVLFDMTNYTATTLPVDVRIDVNCSVDIQDLTNWEDVDGTDVDDPAAAMPTIERLQVASTATVFNAKHFRVACASSEPSNFGDGGAQMQVNLSCDHVEALGSVHLGDVSLGRVTFNVADDANSRQSALLRIDGNIASVFTHPANVAMHADAAVSTAPYLVVTNRTVPLDIADVDLAHRSKHQALALWHGLDSSLVRNSKIFTSALGFPAFSMTAFPVLTQIVDIASSTNAATANDWMRLGSDDAKAWSFQVGMAHGLQTAQSVTFSVHEVTAATFPASADARVIEHLSAAFGPINAKTEAGNAADRTITWTADQKALVREMAVVVSSSPVWRGNYTFTVRAAFSDANGPGKTYDFPVTIQSRVSVDDAGAYAVPQDGSRLPLLRIYNAADTDTVLNNNSGSRVTIQETSSAVEFDLLAQCGLDMVAPMDLAWTVSNAALLSDTLTTWPENFTNSDVASAAKLDMFNATGNSDGVADTGSVTFRFQYLPNAYNHPVSYDFARTLTASWTRSAVTTALTSTTLYATVKDSPDDAFLPAFSKLVAAPEATAGSALYNDGDAYYNGTKGYAAVPTKTDNATETFNWLLRGSKPMRWGFKWRVANAAGPSIAKGDITVRWSINTASFGLAAAGWTISNAWVQTDSAAITEVDVAEVVAPTGRVNGAADKAISSGGQLVVSGDTATVEYTVPAGSLLTDWMCFFAELSAADAFAVVTEDTVTLDQTVLVTASTATNNEDHEILNMKDQTIDGGSVSDATWDAKTKTNVRFTPQGYLTMLRWDDNGTTRYTISGNTESGGIATPSEPTAVVSNTVYDRVCASVNDTLTLGVRKIGKLTASDSAVTYNSFVYWQNLSSAPTAVVAADVAEWVTVSKHTQAYTGHASYDNWVFTVIRPDATPRQDRPFSFAVRAAEQSDAVQDHKWSTAPTAGKLYATAQKVNLVTDVTPGLDSQQTPAAGIAVSSVDSGPQMRLRLDNSPATSGDPTVTFTLTAKYYDASGSAVTLDNGATLAFTGGATMDFTAATFDTYQARTLDLRGLDVASNLDAVKRIDVMAHVSGVSGGTSDYQTDFGESVTDNLRTVAQFVTSFSNSTVNSADNTLDASQIFIGGSFELAMSDTTFIIRQLVNGVWFSGPTLDLTSSPSWTAGTDASASSANDAIHGVNTLYAPTLPAADAFTVVSTDGASFASNRMQRTTLTLSPRTTAPTVGERVVVLGSPDAYLATVVHWDGTAALLSNIYGDTVERRSAAAASLLSVVQEDTMPRRTAWALVNPGASTAAALSADSSVALSATALSTLLGASTYYDDAFSRPTGSLAGVASIKVRRARMWAGYTAGTHYAWPAVTMTRTRDAQSTDIVSGAGLAITGAQQTLNGQTVLVHDVRFSEPPTLLGTDALAITVSDFDMAAHADDVAIAQALPVLRANNNAMVAFEFEY